MKKLLYIALVAALAASFGCAITNYPIITDDRGDYSGTASTSSLKKSTSTPPTSSWWAEACFLTP